MERRVRPGELAAEEPLVRARWLLGDVCTLTAEQPAPAWRGPALVLGLPTRGSLSHAHCDRAPMTFPQTTRVRSQLLSLDINEANTASNRKRKQLGRGHKKCVLHPHLRTSFRGAGSDDPELKASNPLWLKNVWRIRAGMGTGTELGSDLRSELAAGPHQSAGVCLWAGLPRGGGFTGLSKCRAGVKTGLQTAQLCRRVWRVKDQVSGEVLGHASACSAARASTVRPDPAARQQAPRSLCLCRTRLARLAASLPPRLPYFYCGEIQII